MAAEAFDRIELGEWAFSVGMRGGARACHTIHDGAARGAPHRGLVILLAEGLGAVDAGPSAACAAHAFADGYFGAAPTLGAARAAGQALMAINDWLFHQGWSRQAQGQSHVRLGAILLRGRRLGFVVAGDCAVYRRRHGALLPLGEEEADTTRERVPLGSARDIPFGYFESEAKAGDRYLLVAGHVPLRELEATSRDDTSGVELQTAVLWLDLARLPASRPADLGPEFGKLPLREPPQQGEMLDGFEIANTIHRSRYTLLRRARDTVEQRDVLLKFPLPAMLQDQVFQAGFLREAWVGRNVESEWVADTIELPAGRQSCLYIVLPFYRGETLEERLTRQPAVGYAEGMGIALRLCHAVDDLGRRQIIHRDIKPENVVLPIGGGLKLLDLGLAYLPGIDDPNEERLGGTISYMAPELFRNVPPDARSEVFSLGVTAYRMWTGGRFPFGQWEVQPLSRLRPDLPRWLRACLARALATDPARRFADAAAFAQALEAGLNEADEPYSRYRLLRIWFAGPRIWQWLTVLFATSFAVTLLMLLRR
ncbi:MAG: protein kinase [Bradyrhizobium sp.]|uniref:protein kinase domain-containing protein n=1 Tax=Bradyrhizobium sp. TaxID=376 RepID=UPI001E00EEA0|nr:protein kinase [Bradyrhizobium sp.]MBV9563035.1 protein kinase [Bradyrhizobium sp.]